MPPTLAELATLVDGQLAGDGDLIIEGAAPLGEAGPGEITLIDSPDRGGLLKPAGVAAAIAPRTTVPNGVPLILVDNVHQAFARVVAQFRPVRQPRRIGISPRAIVSPTARLGSDVDIHPLATIDDDVEIGDGATIHSGVHVMAGSTIGERTTIFPNVVLYENTVVGARCVIHAGAVLGAFGFGYDTQAGEHRLSPQLGNVVLGADVEIGAGTTIDRGTYGSTTIGEGTKIDNLVMIGHNCRIGCHNLLCAQVGIAGSASTDDHVVMGGQAGIRDHVHIGTKAMIGAQSGVMNHVPEEARLFGTPAGPERKALVQHAALGKLPDLRRRFLAMERRVRKLEDRGEPAHPPDATEEDTTRNI